MLVVWLSMRIRRKVRLGVARITAKAVAEMTVYNHEGDVLKPFLGTAVLSLISVLE